jgi:hypothetical protein
MRSSETRQKIKETVHSIDQSSDYFKSILMLAIPLGADEKVVNGRKKSHPERGGFLLFAI